MKCFVNKFEINKTATGARDCRTMGGRKGAAHLDYAQYTRERITKLRLQKGISEYKMSYDLGHSRGYVNNISSGKALPSMSEFFAICEYFAITPREFFLAEVSDPRAAREALQEMEALREEDLELLRLLAARLRRGAPA